jgi:hypothetical protein
LTEKCAGVEQDTNREINRGCQGDNGERARTGSLRDCAWGRSPRRFIEASHALAAGWLIH